MVLITGKEVEPLTPDRIAAVEVESAANVYNERLFKKFSAITWPYVSNDADRKETSS